MIPCGLVDCWELWNRDNDVAVCGSLRCSHNIHCSLIEEVQSCK
jgi:hypothetical protein